MTMKVIKMPYLSHYYTMLAFPKWNRLYITSNSIHEKKAVMLSVAQPLIVYFFTFFLLSNNIPPKEGTFTSMV